MSKSPEKLSDLDGMWNKREIRQHIASGWVLFKDGHDWYLKRGVSRILVHRAIREYIAALAAEKAFKREQEEIFLTMEEETVGRVIKEPRELVRLISEDGWRYLKF